MTLKPNLFIVGAPKSGTTALSHYLSGHPEVFMSEQAGEKEPKYFAPDIYGWPPAVTTLNEYMSLFSSAPTTVRYRGEASVTYLYSRVAARRIMDFNPQSLFSIVIRNPVEIAQAWHNERLKFGAEKVVDFERAWRLQAKRLRRHALLDVDLAAFKYGEIASIGSQMRRFLTFVPREQIHIIVYDDFSRDPSSVYNGLLLFLRVFYDDRSEFPIMNARVRYKIPTLQQTLHNLDKVRQFMRLPGGLGIQKWVEARNIVMGIPPIRQEFLKELKDYFRSDVDTISEVMGRDLSSWVS